MRCAVQVMVEEAMAAAMWAEVAQVGRPIPHPHGPCARPHGTSTIPHALGWRASHGPKYYAMGMVQAWLGLRLGIECVANEISRQSSSPDDCCSNLHLKSLRSYSTVHFLLINVPGPLRVDDFRRFARNSSQPGNSSQGGRWPTALLQWTTRCLPHCSGLASSLLGAPRRS